MTLSEIPAEVVHRHMQKVLGSPGFTRNERMSRFLRFVVEQRLNGRESELKESVIGIELLPFTFASLYRTDGAAAAARSATIAKAAGGAPREWPDLFLMDSALADPAAALAKLTPRPTIVCAISGRTPEIRHSAPMRRVAFTVFIRCCAVRVSIAGTPVMSTIATSARVAVDMTLDLAYGYAGSSVEGRARSAYRAGIIEAVVHALLRDPVGPGEAAS